MNDSIQARIDSMIAKNQRIRARNQMTLGELIGCLRGMPSKENIILGELHSYRGYYDDLAFARTAKIRPVSAVLAECQAAVGATFSGYKGGDYVMDEQTPLWVADYGTLGKKLIKVSSAGVETEEYDLYDFVRDSDEAGL